MAKDKKGFILYADQKELFDQLPNDKAGELIKFIFAYVNDENPITKDLLLNLAFTPIKQQLKRDLVKYEDKIDKKSIAGREGNLKRWNLDIYTDYKSGKTTLEEAENIANSRKTSHSDKVRSHRVANIAVNDTVNVNDTVTVIDKDINTIHSRKLTFSQSTSKLFDSEFPNDKHHLDDFVEYWTEHGDKDKKMRFEKQKSFSTTRRVKTWIKNNFNNNNYGDKQQNKQTAISIGLNNPNL